MVGASKRPPAEPYGFGEGFIVPREEHSRREPQRERAVKLWRSHPWARRVLREAVTVEEARRTLYAAMVEREREIRSRKLKVHPLEWAIIRDTSRVLRNILSKRCEKMAGFSALGVLWRMAHDRWEELPRDVAPGFFEEFHRLFKGVRGRSKIYEGIESPPYSLLQGRAAARERSGQLDELAEYAEARIDSYACGLDGDIVRRRAANATRIRRAFGADRAEWDDWHWQLQHVVRNASGLAKLVELTDEEHAGIQLAKEHHIPFGVTPYYASLMDAEPHRADDHAVRAQVIPTCAYVERMIEHRKRGVHSADFMLENDTSPVDLVVRRYPRVAIFKPFNTCAQICVYCQRNWEIQDVLCPGALATPQAIDRAMRWFEKHPMVREVLVTGGDPLIMPDGQIEAILKRLAAIPHIERIRIGSRTPVVLPQRFTDRLLRILTRFHEPPRREICLVTHFEHAYEVTPEAADAIERVRREGMSVYNQMVFTVENARRFEAVATRLALKRIGVDPYYTFMMKGKGETDEMRVPLARALQEQKEESRLMPGTVRSDEVVYNVPGLGKNYVKATQNHDVIMVLPDGSRVIEFHPWEKNISLVETYVDRDIPIYDFLERLAARGEQLSEYASIWYYY